MLVPQILVKVQPGELDGSGALLVGKDVNLNLSGDLTNSGTIAGRKFLARQSGAHFLLKFSVAPPIP